MRDPISVHPLHLPLRKCAKPCVRTKPPPLLVQAQLGYGTSDGAANASPRIVEAMKVSC